MTKRALLIGINYFNTDNELHGCIRDVLDMKQMLIDKFKYKEKNMIVLTDDVASNMPTKLNILNKLFHLLSLTTEVDELFIHYSGHGSQVADIDGDEKHNLDAMGMDDAICPCDYAEYDGDMGFITDDELRHILDTKLVKGAKLRAVFDCCHSGSILDLPYQYKYGDSFTKIEPEMTKSNNCLMISGCRDMQTSADAYINGQYNGALTWAILKAMKGQSMNWKELLTVVRYNLVIKGYTQIPMLSVADKGLLKKTVDF